MMAQDDQLQRLLDDLAQDDQLQRLLDDLAQDDQLQRLLDDLAQDLAEIAGLASYPDHEPAKRLARVLCIARRALDRLTHAQDGQS